jgi:uridine kinase
MVDNSLDIIYSFYKPKKYEDSSWYFLQNIEKSRGISGMEQLPDLIQMKINFLWRNTMIIEQKPRVIAIAAVSGGGKTTIVKQLNGKLMNSKALYFDDYDFDDCPDDICEWVENGANYTEWILTPLIDNLQLLLSENNQSLEYILLDYPFAYQHNEMSKLIDFTIFIDTPLDIAMARRILRDNMDTCIEDLRSEMVNYLNRGRFAYLEMLKTIKPNSDYIVDGSLPIASILNILLEIIESPALGQKRGI